MDHKLADSVSATPGIPRNLVRNAMENCADSIVERLEESG